MNSSMFVTGDESPSHELIAGLVFDGLAPAITMKNGVVRNLIVVQEQGQCCSAYYGEIP